MKIPRLSHFLRVVLLTAALLLAGAAHAVAPYVDNGDGTVTDTVTGLMWDQCSLGQGTGCSGTANTYTWADALTAAATQNVALYKGHSDWRLPSMVELESLVKLGSYPAIDTLAFPNTPTSYFWSASTSVPDPASAWYVVFSSGDGYAGDKTFSFRARLVRSGQRLGTFGLLQTGVSGTTKNSTVLAATSPVAATGYWIVVARNATAPSASEVSAGVNYGAVTVLAHGSGTMAGKTAASFAVIGLTSRTDYDLYLVAKDSSPYAGYSDVSGPLRFTTLAISTTSIVIDPISPTRLYAGLDGAGVYKSEDSGGNWTAANTGLANLNVKALQFQSISTVLAGTVSYSSNIYAGTDGGGVFKSIDSGNTWSACTNPGNLNLRSLSLVGSSLYAGTTAGVFVSSDACATWSARNNGLPN